MILMKIIILINCDVAFGQRRYFGIQDNYSLQDRKNEEFFNENTRSQGNQFSLQRRKIQFSINNYNTNSDRFGINEDFQYKPNNEYSIGELYNDFPPQDNYYRQNANINVQRENINQKEVSRTGTQQYEPRFDVTDKNTRHLIVTERSDSKNLINSIKKSIDFNRQNSESLFVPNDIPPNTGINSANTVSSQIISRVNNTKSTNSKKVVPDIENRNIFQADSCPTGKKKVLKMCVPEDK